MEKSGRKKSPLLKAFWERWIEKEVYQGSPALPAFWWLADPQHRANLIQKLKPQGNPNYKPNPHFAGDNTLLDMSDTSKEDKEEEEKEEKRLKDPDPNEAKWPNLPNSTKGAVPLLVTERLGEIESIIDLREVNPKLLPILPNRLTFYQLLDRLCAAGDMDSVLCMLVHLREEGLTVESGNLVNILRSFMQHELYDDANFIIQHINTGPNREIEGLTETVRKKLADQTNKRQQGLAK